MLGGLAALSLDALSSVAYGPEAMMLVLVLAGASALRFTLPLTLVITGMLALLVISYTQVISAYPDGGGAYAVAKANLGRWAALLAAASLVIDFVLGGGEPGRWSGQLGECVPGPVESLAARLAYRPGRAHGGQYVRDHRIGPPADGTGAVARPQHGGGDRDRIGRTLAPFHATDAVGVILLLKALATGCSAVTAVEAIANGVPAFRESRSRTGQRTEISLGVLLAMLLIGLAVVIHLYHIEPRGGVTVLAQAAAGALRTGWPFYVCNIAVAVVLGLAANKSFGGLPVLMSLLARDHRLPHAFYLRAERPVYWIGILVLAVMALLLLVAVSAQTDRLISLFTIGVFVGFTISQIGLVRHWRRERPARWQLRAAVNGVGAAMTAVAVVVSWRQGFSKGRGWSCSWSPWPATKRSADGSSAIWESGSAGRRSR